MILAFALGLALGAAPPIADCGADPLIAASVQFEAMLTGGGPTAELGFADCLAEAGLVHVAQHHYFELVLSQPRSSLVRQAALARAMALVEHTRDPASARWYLLQVRPGDAPRGPGTDALFYALGLNQATEGKHLVAALWFEEVSPGSTWRSAATLARAIALEQGGQEPHALVSYGAVDPSSAERTEAMLRLARLQLRIERYDAALASLDEVWARGERAGEAAALRARVLRAAGREPEAVVWARRAERVASRGGYAPDGALVAARLDLDRCRTGRAHRRLEGALLHDRAVLVALGVVFVGKADGEQRYVNRAGPEPVDWGLPPGLRAEVLRVSERGPIEAHLGVIERERAALAAIEDTRFEAVVAPHLAQILDEGHHQLRALLGRRIGERMAELYGEHEARDREARAMLAEPGCAGPGR